MIKGKKMWVCDGDKLGEESPYSVILSTDPRPIEEMLGYDPFGDRGPPLAIEIPDSRKGGYAIWYCLICGRYYDGDGPCPYCDKDGESSENSK